MSLYIFVKSFISAIVKNTTSQALLNFSRSAVITVLHFESIDKYGTAT